MLNVVDAPKKNVKRDTATTQLCLSGRPQPSSPGPLAGSFLSSLESARFKIIIFAAIQLIQLFSRSRQLTPRRIEWIRRWWRVGCFAPSTWKRCSRHTCELLVVITYISFPLLHYLNKFLPCLDGQTNHMPKGLSLFASHSTCIQMWSPGYVCVFKRIRKGSLGGCASCPSKLACSLFNSWARVFKHSSGVHAFFHTYKDFSGFCSLQQ